MTLTLKRLPVALAMALATMAAASGAMAAERCGDGKTLKEGTLTIATGNPAYFPWVIDDKPEAGKGFEAAVAYAVAAKMGYSKEQVAWVRTGFDEAVQPGAKNFDVNLQQFSITDERKKVIDFSAPYFTSTAAVVTRKRAVDAGAKPVKAELAKLRWGAAAGTTAPGLITKLIGPAQETLLYDDTANMTAALKADQIDAILVDLPTALYVSGVELSDGVVLGQYSHDASGKQDQFGMLLAKDSPLTKCVNEAIDAMTADKSLAAIETEWLQTNTNVPLIAE